MMIDVGFKQIILWLLVFDLAYLISKTETLIGPYKRQDINLLLNSERQLNESIASHSTIGLILAAKFKFEQYNVTSLDGYITQIIKSVNPRVERRSLKRLPVVLYAGQGVGPSIFLLGACERDEPMVWQPEDSMAGSVHNRSLAFTLSNNGYDIWLVPARGVDVAIGRGQTP